MIPSNDSFWNIPAREKAEEDAIRLRIDGIERAQALGKRAQQIRNQPGYQDFVKAVEDMRSGYARQLMLGRVDNNDLRELRGRAQGINDVLAILTQTDHALERLALQHTELQNALAEALKHRPKPKQEAQT